MRFFTLKVKFQHGYKIIQIGHVVIYCLLHCGICCSFYDPKIHSVALLHKDLFIYVIKSTKVEGPFSIHYAKIFTQIGK